MEIEILHEKPEIYEKLRKVFKVDWDKGLIIAYNGKIWAKEACPAQKVIHESIHLKEQAKIGDKAWWTLYFENKVFRFEQEVMAHKAEADFIKKYVKNREHCFHMCREIADSLASGIYGNLITRQEAWKLIK